MSIVKLLQLGGWFHVAHGVSNKVLLPEVLRFNLPHAAERYARVATALGIEGNGSPLNMARRGVEHLACLTQACGVPQRLSELGVPHEALSSIAEPAMQVTRLVRNNPRPVAEDDAMQIYQAIY